MEKEELCEKYRRNSEARKDSTITEQQFKQLHQESVVLTQLIKDKRKECYHVTREREKTKLEYEMANIRNQLVLKKGQTLSKVRTVRKLIRRYNKTYLHEFIFVHTYFYIFKSYNCINFAKLVEAISQSSKVV